MSVTERLWPSIESLRQFQKHLPSTLNICSMIITNSCTDIEPLPSKLQSSNIADASAVVTRPSSLRIDAVNFSRLILPD